MSSGMSERKSELPITLDPIIVLELSGMVCEEFSIFSALTNFYQIPNLCVVEEDVNDVKVMDFSSLLLFIPSYTSC